MNQVNILVKQRKATIAKESIVKIAKEDVERFKTEGWSEDAKNARAKDIIEKVIINNDIIDQPIKDEVCQIYARETGVSIDLEEENTL